MEPRVSVVKKEVDPELFDSIIVDGIKVYFKKRSVQKRKRYKIDFSPKLKDIVIEEIWKV